MQPQDAGFDEESKLVSDKQNPESLASAPEPSFNLMFHRTSIRQKIGFGYALAIGIANAIPMINWLKTRLKQ